MPHVSNKKLKKDHLAHLYRRLVFSLEKTGKKSATIKFLNEFLTQTEKIMLAKRFSVIYLLSRGLPVSYIAEALRMSPATIYRMSLKSEAGKYSFLNRAMKELDESIWDALEKILRAGLPPKAGRGRWKFLYSRK
ncbi:hypothetical protein EPN83_01205 [Patescibacteria group bacterium]|nr:MAG: hypothetical protein EPN83_01205 [Patescibacteria group bacterium]